MAETERRTLMTEEFFFKEIGLIYGLFIATAGFTENSCSLSVSVPIRSIIITTWYLAIGSFQRWWFTCITIQDIEKDEIRLTPLLVLPWAFTSRKIIKNQILSRVATGTCKCPSGRTILTATHCMASLNQIEDVNLERLLIFIVSFSEGTEVNFVLCFMKLTRMSAFKYSRFRFSLDCIHNCQINGCWSP